MIAIRDLLQCAYYQRLLYTITTIIYTREILFEIEILRLLSKISIYYYYYYNIYLKTLFKIKILTIINVYRTYIYRLRKAFS